MTNAGAGNPFSMFGGGDDGLNSLLGGGAYGGDGGLQGLMDYDPSGSTGAEAAISAGTPSPSTPGGGIGGTQSDPQTSPTTAQGAAPTPTTPESGTAASGAMAGSQPTLPSQFQPAAFQLGGPPTVAGPAGPTPTPSTPAASSDYSIGPQGTPQTFADRSGGDLSALGQQALAGRMTGSSAGLPPWLQSATTQSPLDVSQTPGDFPDQPSAGADPTTGTPATPATPSAAGAATPASTTAATPSPTPTTAATPSGTGGTTSTGRSTGTALPGAGAGGQPQAFNIQSIMQALMRGGPMGALEALVQEAMGQGMGQGMGTPAMAGQGAGGVPSPQQFQHLYQQYQQAHGRPPPGQTPQQYRQQYQPTGSGAAPSTPSATPPTEPSAPAPTSPAEAPTAIAPGTRPEDYQATGGVPAQTAGDGTTPPTGSGGVVGSATPALVSPQVIARTQMAGSDTRPTPGYSNYLRQQRAPAARELQNPQTRLQVAAMMSLENGRDPIGPVESLLNRQAMTGQSLQRLLHSGFYGPINRRQLGAAMQRLQNNPRLFAFYNSHIDAALSGSNVIGGATDQGTTGDPNARNPSGRVRRGTEIYNDWGGARNSAGWRRAQQAQVQAELQGQQPQIVAAQ
jgi:hypothetical protein